MDHSLFSLDFLKAWLTSLKICAFFINSSFLRSSLSSFFLQLEISLQGLVFWNSIHLEVASDSFCFLINSSWLLVFILYVFFMIFSGFNLYCWKGIHFSQNNFLYFLLLFLGLIFSFHFWFRDLLRELDKKYEVLLIIFFLVFLLFLVSEGLLFVSFFWTSFHSLSSPTLGTWPGEGFYLPDPCELTFANTLLLSNAAISLGNAFISLEISSQFSIFFSLFSFILAWTFISLQIKEFRIMGLSINDSVYSCLFFFLTGLHFFHLLVGLLLCCLLFWSCSFSSFSISRNLSEPSLDNSWFIWNAWNTNNGRYELVKIIGQMSKALQDRKGLKLKRFQSST